MLCVVRLLVMRDERSGTNFRGQIGSEGKLVSAVWDRSN